MNWEAIQKFVTAVGIPAAFAIALLWFVLHDLNKRLDAALAVQRHIEQCACGKGTEIR